MIVRLKRQNARYHDVSTRQPYVVIGVEADDLRILNDVGRPCLYPSRLFAVVDRGEPTDWMTEFGTDGERYAYPPPLDEPGFFEDFFDDKPKAVATFWRMINHRLSSEGASTAVISDARRPNPSRSPR
jgi:hypothetical protein